MTHKAFVASTFEDLRAHRARIIDVLRGCGIHVDPMEAWTATTAAPKEFSPARLKGCDLCILLVAFRRGHVPVGETQSITQLEYRTAREAKMDVHVYLLADTARWEDRFDERETDPGIREWRAELGELHGVKYFDADPASISIESALVRWAFEQNEATPRPLMLADNLVDLEQPAVIGGSMVSQIETDLSAVIGFGRREALVVDLRGGRAWWSTRLYLLASLIRDFTGVRLIAITDNAEYVGSVTPTGLATGLVGVQPELGGHYDKQDGFSTEQAMSHSTRRFAESFEDESSVKTWMTTDNLKTALGTRLNTEQVRVSDSSQAKTIRFLYEVIRRPTDQVAVVHRDGSLVCVVDRARLATQIAEDQLAAHLG